jgi:adenine phosphoribosyltransferase
MTSSAPIPDAIRAAIRNIPDFPQPGIQFKDITPVLADARLLAAAIDVLAAGFQPGSVDAVVGIEARGFVFAPAVALRLQAGFVPVRKPGKLPWKTFEESYALEYGANTLAIHQDALHPGARVLLVDDLLATGGTAAATAALVQKAGGRVLGASFLVELSFLKGRDRLKAFPVSTVVTY